MTDGGIRGLELGSRETGLQAAEDGDVGESGVLRPPRGVQELQSSEDVEEPDGAGVRQQINRPELPEAGVRPRGPTRVVRREQGPGRGPVLVQALWLPTSPGV